MTNQLDLICLGVGSGSSYVLKGIASTAFCIRRDSQPYLLVDCGAGILLSCVRHLNTIPQTVYLTHNHLDHTGDLPVMIYTPGSTVRVLGHSDVLEIVKAHRMHDDPETMADGIARAKWISQDNLMAIGLEHGLRLRLFRSHHDYLTYGFTLWHDNHLLLGYTADSRFDMDVYREISAAPIALVDGRAYAGSDHASFDEVDNYALTTPGCRYFVVHHENSQHGFQAPNVQLLREGDVIALGVEQSGRPSPKT